jgi:hypothetical protein
MLFEAREIVIEQQPMANIYRNKILVGTAVKEAGIFFLYDVDQKLVGTFPNLFMMAITLSFN